MNRNTAATLPPKAATAARNTARWLAANPAATPAILSAAAMLVVAFRIRQLRRAAHSRPAAAAGHGKTSQADLAAGQFSSADATAAAIEAGRRLHHRGYR